MKIEYIYPDDDDNNKNLAAQLKQMQKESTLGCLIAALVLLSGVFILLAVIPILLTIIGWSILVLGVYIVYKAYLEEPVQNFIQKLKARRK